MQWNAMEWNGINEVNGVNRVERRGMKRVERSGTERADHNEQLQ